MSKKKAFSATLDNTLHHRKEDLLKNSTTSIVSENTANPMENGVERNTKPQLSKIETSIHEQLDPEEYEVDIMTGSYGEISLEQDVIGCIENSVSLSTEKVTEVQELCGSLNCNSERVSGNDVKKEKKRPDSLILSKNSSSSNVLSGEDELGAMGGGDQSCRKCVHKSQQTSDSQTTSVDGSPSLSSEEYALHCSGHHRSGSDTSGLSELQGTLTVDGDMVTFVAEDLQEKIKMSSPVSRWADSSFPGSRSSTPSLYKQALQPHIQRIDPNVVIDLESHAKKVASCVDTMLENLSGTLQSISSLTVDCMENYETAVCKTCDAVDVNIKAVYQLMAKCEELSNSMGPLHQIADDVKNIKKVLDQLEHVVEHKS